jgi:HK97 family phage major capsid protein/HK97 family phage prohead protease
MSKPTEPGALAAAIAGAVHQRKAPTALPPLTRYAAMQAAAPVDAQARTLQFTFSSEYPVERWFGNEVLSHAPDAADLSRLNDGAPLLFNHNLDDVIGVVESATVDPAQRKGIASVRFADTPRADEVMRMVQDGILRNVSFMYRVGNYVDLGNDEFIATDWTPMELSIVTVPADPTVGIGRHVDEGERPVRVQRVAEIAQAAPAAAVESATPVVSPPAPAARTTPATGDIIMSEATPTPAGTSNAATVVDINQARADAASAERQRIAEIEAMCAAHKLPVELRAKLVKDGTGIPEARGIVLAELGKRGEPQSLSANGHAPDLTEKERGEYSMIRAINAAINGNWKNAGFELEVSNEIAKRMGKATSGFYMPTNLPLSARAYNTGTDASGGALKPTNLLAGSFIEVLRNKARVLSLGATVLSGLTGKVDIPRRASAVTTYWVGEGTDVTENEGTFDKVSLDMKTVGAVSVITRNMLMQATPDIEMLARADMVAQLALAIDLAALSGSGSAAQPKGIANTAGVGSVVGGTDGGAITIDNLIDLETAVTAANAPEDSLAYLCNARTVGALKKLKSTTGEYLWISTADMGRTGTPGEINGYPVARSNQARSSLTKGTGTNLSEVFFGAWSELIVGEWGVMEVLPNPYAASVARQGGVEIRALQSIDIAVRHAASFAVMSDAITG